MTFRNYGEPVPLFRVNEYRVDGHNGWVEPKIVEDGGWGGADSRMTHAADTVTATVRRRLHETLGIAGIRAILDCYPTFFADLRLSLIEMYREGHYESWGEGLIRASNESMASTGRLVSAMLKSAVNGEGPTASNLRMFAAHAGVEEETLNGSPAMERAQAGDEALFEAEIEALNDERGEP